MMQAPVTSICNPIKGALTSSLTASRTFGLPLMTSWWSSVGMVLTTMDALIDMSEWTIKAA